MNAADFIASLEGAAPAPELNAPLAGLWWAAKGDWDRAHTIVQDERSSDAAWVHAYLHRVEGDLGNAGYWYRRAGVAPFEGSFADEAEAMLAELGAD